jgi:N-acetylglucosaminyldiphosphoundecaprenol N-acetyl-beta-D-mannosaminyltransferase
MAADHRLPVVACAGVPVTACTRQEGAREVVRLATTEIPTGHDVHLCNAYTLALADQDPTLRHLLRTASVNFPDGMSVVWANRLRHRRQDLPRGRVYGPDLFLDVFALGQAARVAHYLLGSTPDVLDRLVDQLQQRFPDARIVGSESPPFRTLTHEEEAEQLERIRASGAQLVWVGLGTPKQDVESARISRALPVTCVAVGAAFDFVAGTKKQAPEWMQDHGLEWSYRLATEPRRLWRRYLLGNVRFVWAAVRG